MSAGTALVLREQPVDLAMLPMAELELLRDRVADVEILCYEAWYYDDRLTKDAARRMLGIAAIFGWDFEWVAEMREWAA